MVGTMLIAVIVACMPLNGVPPGGGRLRALLQATALKTRSGEGRDGNAPRALLGEGGMGVVYKAFDTRLNRPVALKVLRPDAVSDAARRQRFVQEARTASALNHPHIITVYDIASVEGTDYIAMEYVSGKPLDQVIGRTGLPLAQVLRNGIQIADAPDRGAPGGHCPPGSQAG